MALESVILAGVTKISALGMKIAATSSILSTPSVKNPIRTSGLRRKRGVLGCAFSRSASISGLLGLCFLKIRSGAGLDFLRFRPKLMISDRQKRQYISALGGKFPTQANREFISPNREFLATNRETAGPNRDCRKRMLAPGNHHVQQLEPEDKIHCRRRGDMAANRRPT